MIAGTLAEPRLPFRLLLLGGYLVFGTFIALNQITWGDESGYLFLGDLAVRGKVSLFQDEMLGERMPLPFYVLGLSQLATGPSLLVARLLSLGLGLAVILLTWRLAARFGAPGSGPLAALLLAAHGLTVSLWASAMYYSFAALLLVVGMELMLDGERPERRVWGMAVLGLLPLTRANLAPIVPFVLAYALWRANTRRERLCLAAAGLGPIVVFFMSDVRHWKMLAYVPVLSGIALALDYQSLFALGGLDLTQASGWDVFAGLVWFARGYVWWLAALVLIVAVRLSCALMPRVGEDRWMSPALWLVAGLFLWTLGWQFAILWKYAKSVAVWSAAFMPLAAIVLGHLLAVALARGPRRPRWGWAPAMGGIVLAVLLPVKPALSGMPLTIAPHRPTIFDLSQAADRLAAAVPAEARIFLLGISVPLHLAGRVPYVQQVIHTWTLVPRGEPRRLARSGLWGAQEIEHWLGEEATHAVIQRSVIVHLARVQGYDQLVARISTLLSERFELITVVRDYPWIPLEVYRRRKGA